MERRWATQKEIKGCGLKLLIDEELPLAKREIEIGNIEGALEFLDRINYFLQEANKWEAYPLDELKSDCVKYNDLLSSLKISEEIRKGYSLPERFPIKQKAETSA